MNSKAAGLERSGIQRGFTLIEAAVAIAVVAILAGAMVPLANRMLNQQREIKTREALKTAFEAMFGAKERRVANMQSDFGFCPTTSLTNLSLLIAKSGTWAGVRNYAQDATYRVYWGYNGPYWSGSTAANNPLDAWGRVLKLKVTGTSPNQTWQVYSPGVNGVDESGAGDDLVYPPTPASATSFSAILNVSLRYHGSHSGSVSVYTRNPVGTAMVLTNYFIPPNYSGTIWSWTNRFSPPTLTYNVPAGGVAVVVTYSGTTTTYVLDLLPGEIRDFTLSY